MYFYKKIVVDFSKITIFFIIIIISFSLYHSKNFNLDASSDALLLEGDKDLKYLREVNDRYGSKDFLVLTYTPVSSFTEKETILNLQLLKSKIEKLTWVDSVITVIDVPLLKSTDENNTIIDCPNDEDFHINIYGNDFGYENLYEKMVIALGNKGDCLIGITTSGNSENVLRALKKAKEILEVESLLKDEEGNDAVEADANEEMLAAIKRRKKLQRIRLARANAIARTLA